MFSIKQKAMQSAKRAGFMSGGFVLCTVGLGFFTLASWFYLSIEFSPLQAALIIGVAYFGVGLILIGLGKSATSDPDPIRKDPYPAAQPSNTPPLMQALMYGIQAGINTSKPKR